MNRLLFGTGIALLTSAAHAADPVVVAEPEPMEYVRICEAYGVGFYYIPGTETCLKVGGYVRMDVGAGAFGLTNVADKSDPGFRFDPNLNDTYDMRARFQLRLDSRAETELGTLRTYAAINFQYETFADQEDYYSFNLTNTTDYLSIEHAYIELAGFRVGKTDSLFSTFTGYGGGVINDDIIGYGPYGTHQFAYGWGNDDGFGAAIALEVGDGDLVAPFLVPAFGDPNLYTIDSYVPHVVAGVGWQGAWGGASLVAGYDSVWEEGAVKARVDFYPTDRLALFAMAGWSSYDSDYLSRDYYYDSSGLHDFAVKDSPNYYAPWGGNWAVWAGGSFMLTDKATLNVQASYDQMEDFAIVANVAYEIVPNFVITPEIAYIDSFNDEFQAWNEYWDDRKVPSESWGFFVRAQANFGG
ncbi:MAG: porin [Alphaproteobacteria bacterium]|nr:porin [Alphaproteobacteria bacterium]MBU0802948.1 porin [Alphaproteobacteria bacterium]MBU0870941.1 porin [Alphaproteobacteria bacterium]MBU1403388.1 porin [Alphaproteobacteria bacterium]MBU1589724.1 porin [Alphaproteobacteria bacterium]